MPIFEINYWAVLVAAIAQMGVGTLWYSPLLFVKPWMKEMGFKKDDMKNKPNMGLTYLAAFITSLVTAYVLAHFVDMAGATTAQGACQLAFWIWLGFLATRGLGIVLWEGKTIKLYGINVAYDLVGLSVMSLILTLWI